MDCKNCIFANKAESGEQVGCEAGRLEVLKDLGKAEMTDEGHFELSKFCNMFRDNKYEGDLELARKEVQSSFGVVIFAEKGDSDKVIESLESLRNVNYSKGHFKIVVSFLGVEKVNKLADAINKMVNDEFMCEVSFHFENNWWINERYTFKKVIAASHFVTMDAGDKIDPDMFKFIDQSVNDKLEAFCLVEDGSISVALKSIVNQMYVEHEGYKACISHLRKIAKEQELYLKYENKQ